MDYRNLGDSILKTSVIGIGGLHFGVFVDEKQTRRIVHEAIDQGINLIDTAPQYGQGISEKWIGQAVHDRRSKVLLTTKAGLKPTTTPEGFFGVETVPLTRKLIHLMVEQSLKDLRTDYIDLFQVHAFDPSVPLEETIAAIDELLKAGKIRFAGCCNYEAAQIFLSRKISSDQGMIKFISCQMHYNLVERRAEDELIPACDRLNMGIIVYRALARGILSAQYKADQDPPPSSRASVSHRVARWLEPKTLSLIQKLDQWAKERNRCATELSIAWLLSKSPMSIALVGVRTVEQLQTCLRSIDWRLSVEELQEIDQIVEEAGLIGQVRERPETFLEK